MVMTAVSGRVIAAAPREDGRWVLSEALPDEQLGAGLGVLWALALVIMGPVGFATYSVARALSEPLAELRDAARHIVEHGELRRRQAALLFAADDDDRVPHVRTCCTSGR